MTIIVSSVLLLAGFFFIVKSADLLTDGASGIAKVFGIPEFVIGLTIVGIGTSAPELGVSAVAAYTGCSGIAVGNAVGSCIANIGLILGITVLSGSILFEKRTIDEDLPLLLIVVLLLYVVTAGGLLPRLIGMLFLAGQIGYLAHIVRREARDRKKRVVHRADKGGLKKDVILVLVGLVGTILAARYAVVPASVSLARVFGVPEAVIGASIVAVGTSLPELSTAVVASVKKMGGLAAGTIIGSNVFNILLVLGVAAIISPLSVDVQTRLVTIPVTLFITLLLYIFARTGYELSRREGIVLLFLYVGYIIYLFTGVNLG